jgi:SAM-dependent methyltransferase
MTKASDLSSCALQSCCGDGPSMAEAVVRQRWSWAPLFAITIFLGAFLLFQVQPIMGKYILPWFGGSPGVWTTCMLFFQLVLFAGYLYSHLLSRWFAVKNQVSIHVCLLILSACTLPIAPAASWKPNSGDSPILLISWLLLCKVGVPYFLLSATGPLLQSWLSASRIIERPYRLYSLSNLGSVLALLSFPFVFEPTFSSAEQSTLWSSIFVIYGVLCIIAGWGISRLTPSADTVARQREPKIDTAAHPVSWPQLLGWLVCAALPTALLLATTNQVCQDTAVVPFLWVIPLTIYLMSFILTFESDRWYKRRLCIQLAAISFLILYGSKLISWKLPLSLEIGLYFSGLFFACMVCHGELVAKRPHSSKLTLFYMTISAGGALAGIFIGLIAPILFQGFYEFQLALLCCLMLFMATYLESNQYWTTRVPGWSKIAIAITIPALAYLFVTVGNAYSNQQLVAKRNFYGVLSVTDGHDAGSGQKLRKLVHGRIVHGSQFIGHNLGNLPTTYYTHTSGIGRALQTLTSDNRRIGVVGLGVGTLATYGQPGDHFRFYEINPDVIDFAQKYFSFLSDSQATNEIVLGDARLQLEREEPQQFDLLVLDAFSGDAIPVHLLTKEAVQIYRRHLKPDGKIAIHISNLYFDLKPIILGLAESQQLHCSFVAGGIRESLNAYESTWALLSADQEWLGLIDEAGSSQKPKAAKLILWTDDKNNLFEVLK